MAMQSQFEKVNILLIEDDVVDVRAIQRALEQEQLLNPLHIAKDGVEALEMLKGENGRDKVPQPLLILLDLNMPRMNGLRFLELLRSDPRTAKNVVFVLTTSNSEQDRCSAYRKNIAGYIVKDHVGDDFLSVVRLVRDYMSAVQLPKNS